MTASACYEKLLEVLLIVLVDTIPFKGTFIPLNFKESFTNVHVQVFFLLSIKILCSLKERLINLACVCPQEMQV